MVSFESIDVIIRFLQGLDASVKGLVIPDPLESGSGSQTSNTVQTGMSPKKSSYCLSKIP